MIILIEYLYSKLLEVIILEHPRGRKGCATWE